MVSFVRVISCVGAFSCQIIDILFPCMWFACIFIPSEYANVKSEFSGKGAI